jgi:hypothetical protein
MYRILTIGGNRWKIANGSVCREVWYSGPLLKEQQWHNEQDD